MHYHQVAVRQSVYCDSGVQLDARDMSIERCSCAVEPNNKFMKGRLPVSMISKMLCGATVLGALNLVAPVANANVMLTFNVGNVMQNECTGAMQPTCLQTSVNGFVESLVIESSPLYTADTSFGIVMQSSALYGFPDVRTGTPYTSTLAARVSNTLTGGQAFTQIDTIFDSGSLSGNSSALIYSDLLSDTTDDAGNRTQQEYKISYNLLGNFFSSQLYVNLASDSLYTFFSQQLGNIGSFDELGATSTFDPNGLGLNPYAFTEYTGDIALISVQNVPEPGMIALCCAGLLGIAGVRRARKSAFGKA